MSLVVLVLKSLFFSACIMFVYIALRNKWQDHKSSD